MNRKRGRPGRPSKITAELESELWAAIADGSTTKEACRKVGIDYSSVARKLAADAEFRDRRARAYLHGTVFYLDAAEEGLRTATPSDICVRREIAHHARWRAAKMLPAFSDRLAVQAEVTTQNVPTRETILETARRVAHLMWLAQHQPPDPGRVLLLTEVADAEIVPAVPAPAEREINPRFAEPEDDDSADVF